ncbi:hypothetical protein DMENIID0001_091010 [Sergentomyia squamirostris]
MKSNLDIFSLKHRIFLVKHFYQAMGDYMSVRTDYEKIYKKDSPEFSIDALDEFIRLFEGTGCVFKWKEEALHEENEIEQIYLNDEISPERDETDDSSPSPMKIEDQDDFMNLSDDFHENEPKSIPRNNQNTSSNAYMCDLCGRDFKGIKKFKKHQLTHTEKTPYVCDLCGKVFTGKRDFDKHQMTHNKNTDSRSRTRNCQKEGTSDSITSKMAESNKCQKSIKNTEKRRQAIIDAHTRNPEFSYSKIAEMTGSSRGTVRNVVLRFKDTQTVVRKPGCGRKLGFLDQNIVNRVLDIFKRIPDISTREVALNLGISHTQVARIKRRNGLPSFKGKPTAENKDEHKKKTGISKGKRCLK